MKKIFCLAGILSLFIPDAFCEDKYYPYVDTSAVWYVEKEIKVRLSPNGSVFSDETFKTYEKHYYKKDSFVDGIQYYSAQVEFMGLDSVLQVGLSYEMDSVVYAVASIDRRDEILPQYDFRYPTDERIDAGGYLLSEYESVAEGYSLYEAIGYGSGYTVLVHGLIYYFDGSDIVWSINNYHLKESKFLCYERDGKVIYKSTPDTDCWPEATSVSVLDAEQSVLQNPVSSIFEIPLNGESVVQIRNSSGRLIHSVDTKGLNSITINPTNYTLGLYNICLIGDDVRVFKIIFKP